MLQPSNKQWVSPFLGITFIAVSLTGVIMMFQHKIHLLNQIHQWGGILFIAGGLLHLLLNWRRFSSYFQNRKAFLGACAGVLTIALLVTLLPHNNDHDKHRGHGWPNGDRGYYNTPYKK